MNVVPERIHARAAVAAATAESARGRQTLRAARGQQRLQSTVVMFQQLHDVRLCVSDNYQTRLSLST